MVYNFPSFVNNKTWDTMIGSFPPLKLFKMCVTVEGKMMTSSGFINSGDGIHMTWKRIGGGERKRYGWEAYKHYLNAGVRW